MSYYKSYDSCGGFIVGLVWTWWIIRLIVTIFVREHEVADKITWFIFIILISGCIFISYILEYYQVKNKGNGIVKEIYPKLKNIDENNIKNTVINLENQYKQFQIVNSQDIEKIVRWREKDV